MDVNQKTPKKNSSFPKNNELAGYSPIILARSPAADSPQRNLTGTPRVARDIAADLYNNIQRWNDYHIKGAQIVKQIAVLKSDDPKNYSPELEQHCYDLYETVQNLLVCDTCFEQLKTQITALGKLQKNSEPVFISLNTTSLANLVEFVADAYRNEFRIKEMVLENIAHSKNKDEVMFFAACWTLQSYITRDVNLKLETLLVETGHRKFN